jgi:hypothetical protein
VKTEVAESKKGKVKKGSSEEGKEGGREEEEEEEEEEDGDGGSPVRFRNLHQYFFVVSDTFLDTRCHCMLLQSSRQVPN